MYIFKDWFPSKAPKSTCIQILNVDWGNNPVPHASKTWRWTGAGFLLWQNVLSVSAYFAMEITTFLTNATFDDWLDYPTCPRTGLDSMWAISCKKNYLQRQACRWAKISVNRNTSQYVVKWIWVQLYLLPIGHRFIYKMFFKHWLPTLSKPYYLIVFVWWDLMNDNAILVVLKFSRQFLGE